MYNNNNNNILNSTLATSNPFSFNRPGGQSLTDSSMFDAYNKLEALKQQQLAALQAQQQKQQQLTAQTVFTDIATEAKDMSEDERNFVYSSQEYQKLYTQYQQEFSEFITAKFANEYLQAGNRKNFRRIA